MPFRPTSFIVSVLESVLIQTATIGARIVIDGAGTFGNYVAFFTGKATESTPASITASNAPDALISVAFTSGSSTADPGTAAVLTLEADPSLPGSRASLDATAVEINGADLVGVWETYNPQVTATTTDPVGGTTSGRYWRCGSLVVVTFRVFANFGWNPGAGYYFVSLPIPADTTVLYNGAGFLYNATAAGFYAGTWYVNAAGDVATFIIGDDPAGQAMSADNVPAGSNFTGTIVYEAAA